MKTIMVNLKRDIRYVCRADKGRYLNDRRADKRRYRNDHRGDKRRNWHDRRADSQCPGERQGLTSLFKHLDLNKAYFTIFCWFAAFKTKN